MGSDWRLPSLNELQTLIDETQVKSAVPDIFPDRTDDLYWTSSIRIDTQSDAWFVSIGAGNTYWLPTSQLFHARCVR
jgi:hypothetical protein